MPAAIDVRDLVVRYGPVTAVDGLNLTCEGGEVLALLSPGQGAQTPGMLSPWLDVDNVAERLRWACAITGLDLVDIGVNGDEEVVRDTAHAQPLLAALALAVAGSATIAASNCSAVGGWNGCVRMVAQATPVWLQISISRSP